MIHHTSHARRGAMAAVLTLLVPSIAPADPYYPAWGQLYKTGVSSSQFPKAAAVDARGNVFVTGVQDVGNGKGIYTAKYDALDGHVVWFREVAPGNNQYLPYDIAVDSQGNCVVTGSRNIGGAIDYYTIKYAGLDGDPVWANPATYNGPNSGEDTALKVVCDFNNDVIVTGRSVGLFNGNSTGFDFATIKYNGDTGAQIGVVDRYSQTTSNLDDVPAALAVTSNNTICVGGLVRVAAGEERFYLRKLNPADLSKQSDISPIDNGEGGITAMTVDSNNAVIATGGARSGNQFGYFTAKFNANGTEVWRISGPFSASDFGPIPRPGPTGIAVGPDNAPIVTGYLLDAAGNHVIRTEKYTSAGSGGVATSFWPAPAVDNGLGNGDSNGRAIFADGAGNAVVIGDSDNEDNDRDVYIAKYDALTGQKVFSTSYAGSFGSDDLGVDIAADRFGNIAALGEFNEDKGTGIGYRAFGTIKFGRFILPTGDELPDNIPGVDNNAKVLLASPPAISSSGVLATRITFKGTKAGAAIVVEGSAAGGTLLPAVKGQPAPVAPGEPAVNWASFSDPVVSADGSYAFPAKVTGPGNKAKGVWVRFAGGNLQLALRQGSVVPGMTEKLVSVTNIAIEDGSLVALVKVAAPGTSNVALVRINSALQGNVLLRTGMNDLSVNGENHTVKTITVFTPPTLEAGDGRWQGANGVVARVTSVQNTNAKVKATSVVSITNAGVKTVRFTTGQAAAAPVASATYSAFGLPVTATGTLGFSVKATLTPRPGTTNAALVFTNNGSMSNAYAEKGKPTGLTGFSPSITYADFTDPILNPGNSVTFIGTLKGPAAEVKGTSNKVVVSAAPGGNTSFAIARTGDPAPDAAGNESEFQFTAFSALALPGGISPGPIFVGKISAKKNNLGIWARDTSGKVRQLLRVGDKLGEQTVKKFTLLTAVPQAMAAPRSFDSGGSVAVQVTFTDNKSAIVRIGIP